MPRLRKAPSRSSPVGLGPARFPDVCADPRERLAAEVDSQPATMLGVAGRLTDVRSVPQP